MARLDLQQKTVTLAPLALGVSTWDIRAGMTHRDLPWCYPRDDGDLACGMARWVRGTF
jgi:hypothetical protein